MICSAAQVTDGAMTRGKYVHLCRASLVIPTTQSESDHPNVGNLHREISEDHAGRQTLLQRFHLQELRLRGLHRVSGVEVSGLFGMF